jgi:cytochrome c
MLSASEKNTTTASWAFNILLRCIAGAAEILGLFSCNLNAAIRANLKRIFCEYISRRKTMKRYLIGTTAAAVIFFTSSAFATDMPPLAKKLGCTACHTIDTKLVGPAWKDVGAKYAGAKSFKFNGKDYPLAEGLEMKVAKGGSGNWGAVPMTPNDPTGAKKADITEMVKFILALHKK